MRRNTKSHAAEPLAKKVFGGIFLILSIWVTVFFIEDLHVLAQIPIMAVSCVIAVVIAETLWTAMGDAGQELAQALLRKWPLLILLVGGLGLGGMRVFAPEKYAAYMEDQKAKQAARGPKVHLFVNQKAKRFEVLTFSQAVHQCEELGSTWHLSTENELLDRLSKVQQAKKRFSLPTVKISFWTSSVLDDETVTVASAVPDENNPGVTRWTMLKFSKEEGEYSAMCVRK